MNKNKVSANELGFNDLSYKGNITIKHKCDGCGCTFEKYPSEYIYTLKEKKKYNYKTLKFCTYNCRSSYLKSKKELE